MQDSVCLERIMCRRLWTRRHSCRRTVLGTSLGICRWAAAMLEGCLSTTRVAFILIQHSSIDPGTSGSAHLHLGQCAVHFLLHSSFCRALASGHPPMSRWSALLHMCSGLPTCCSQTKSRRCWRQCPTWRCWKPWIQPSWPPSWTAQVSTGAWQEGSREAGPEGEAPQGQAHDAPHVGASTHTCPWGVADHAFLCTALCSSVCCCCCRLPGRLA